MKYLISVITFVLAGCAGSSQEPAIIVKDNAAKDSYIDVLESIASTAAAGVKAVKETLNKDDISYKLLDNQELRLAGIKPPSVVELDKYREIIANKDTKRAEADKTEAAKVDEETTELYGTVAMLDSQLAEEKLRRAESDLIAERALKQEFRTTLQNYGLYLTIGGILVMAFLKNLFKSGIIMCLGGIVLWSSAYFADSPVVKWILGVTATLVAIELLWLSFCKIKEYHLGRKNLPKTETQ